MADAGFRSFYGAPDEGGYATSLVIGTMTPLRCDPVVLDTSDNTLCEGDPPGDGTSSGSAQGLKYDRGSGTWLIDFMYDNPTHTTMSGAVQVPQHSIWRAVAPSPPVETKGWTIGAIGW